VQRLRPALGTWVAIEAIARTRVEAAAGIEAAYAAVAEIERQLHPQRQGSELERINSAAARTRVSIHPTTWWLLQLAQLLHSLSDGMFDPCLPSATGRLCDLTLSPRGETSPWALCRVPLALDLGGMAKGYAVDRAVEALQDAGCESGLVNAGGDLRVRGRSVTILLRHADGACSPVTITDEALAVSDLDAGQRPAEHHGYYSRCGPVRFVRRYAAVAAARAVIADALTKCVLLSGEHCAARALQALDARCIG
jgi:thiamine biosynthesis lipoprotein